MASLMLLITLMLLTATMTTSLHENYSDGLSGGDINHSNRRISTKPTTPPSTEDGALALPPFLWITQQAQVQEKAFKDYVIYYNNQNERNRTIQHHGVSLPWYTYMSPLLLLPLPCAPMNFFRWL